MTVAMVKLLCLNQRLNEIGGRDREVRGEEIEVGKPGQVDVHMGIEPGKTESKITLEGMEKELVFIFNGN